MSNERSPREVCSITIGIRGLISGWLLAAGGPQFRFGRWFFLVGRPDLLARGVLLGRDRLHLGGEPVERALEPQVLAQLVDSGLHDLLDRRVDVLAGGLRLLAHEL